MLIKKWFYKWGWDTRCRNLVPSRLLRTIIQKLHSDRRLILDVGCGDFGLAAFLPDVSFVGVDVNQPTTCLSNMRFRVGSVAHLDFADQSFPIVICIDVLEHLPESARIRAIREMLRVSSEAVLIGCPHGEIAQDCDEEFRRVLESRGRPLPPWLEEHLKQPYPVENEIVVELERAAVASDRRVEVSRAYAEPIRFSRLIRAAAARSSLLYAALNIFLGIWSPFISKPGRENSYRVFLVAEFVQSGNR